jgi:hypothetical protein
VTRVYICVDGARSLEEQSMVNNVHQIVLDAVDNDEIEIEYRFRDTNVGCSASVLSSCEWFFSKVDYGIVLEDDCIPSAGFFDFVEASKPLLINNSDIAIASGCQMLEIQDDNIPDWFLSKYSFHWGWASTAKSWKESLNYALNFHIHSKALKNKILNPEESFWFGGARRAYYGYSDVWDTLFTVAVMSCEKTVLLPKKNLVSNTGNDIYATHTGTNDTDTSRPTYEFKKPSVAPILIATYDSKIAREYFKIRIRHLFTTRATYLLDLLMPSRKSLDVLPERFKNSIFF